MAQDSLLTIVQNATGELGQPQPTAVASATDPQTIQLFTLAKREVKELLASHPWTALQTLFLVNVANPIIVTGNTVNGSTTISNLSSTAGLTTTPASFVVTDTGGVMITSTRLVSVNAGLLTAVIDTPAQGTTTGNTLTFSQDLYALPTDFDRYVGTTWWDRTNRWMLLGPDSPQIDEWHRSGIVVTGPRRHWRQVGQLPNAWRIWPPLTTAATTPQTLMFEYISNKCVNSSGGTGQTTFLADSDVPILDSNAITLGLKWRWMQAKRYQYADFQSEYLDYVDRLKARDGGSGIMSLAPTASPDLITPGNVQDGFYPGTSSVTGR